MQFTVRGGIHTQVATLNVNMTLESGIPPPHAFFNFDCGKKYSLVSYEKVIFLNGLFILPQNFFKNSGRITSVYILPQNWSSGFSKDTFIIVAQIFSYFPSRNAFFFFFWLCTESSDTTVQTPLIKRTIQQNCGHPS